MIRLYQNCTRIGLALLVIVATPGAAELSSTPESPLYLNTTPAWDRDRKKIYHKDEGARLFPYDWFLALEQLQSNNLFKADENVLRYGFLPDSADAQHNKDGLPVGFTKYEPKDSKNSVDEEVDEKMDKEFACDATSGEPKPKALPQLGLNCAACHTGELHYTNPKTRQRYILRIEGGPSMQDNLAFFKAMMDALKTIAVSNDQRFNDFAEEVLKKTAHQGQKPAELRTCVLKFLEDYQERNSNKRYPTPADIFPLPWGFGRIDAFGRGGNTIFAKLDLANILPADAPVSIPPVWSTVWMYDWVHWTGLAQDLRGRYIAQALGMNAFVRVSGDPPGFFETGVGRCIAKKIGMNAPVRLPGDPPGIFETGFDLHEMDWIASEYQKLSPPSWPFDKFDDGMTKSERNELVARGKALYTEKRCEGCHLHYEKDWLSLNDKGKLSLKRIPVSEIGTDPAAATNLYDRMVKTGTLSKYLNADQLSAVQVAKFLTTGIMEKNGLDACDNEWVARREYIARPHAGIWATAPFLHNGSVPNLYELLSPVEKRSKTFCVGSLEFDPELVGFRTDVCAEGEIPFNTALPGNLNIGHEYRNDDRAGNKVDCAALSKHAENGILGCELKHEERMAIIEYLKTLGEIDGAAVNLQQRKP